MKTIEFYFDLGSPYSFLGFHQIQKIAKQYHAEIVYKPMLLGAVFQATGNRSPITIPAKADYTMIDIQRWAQLWEIPLKMPLDFPINTLGLMRLVIAVQLFAPEQFLAVLTGLFQAMFRTPQNLNEPAKLIQVTAELGLEIEQVKLWLQDEKVKNELKVRTEQAIERGIFGAPTFFVKDEMYWGVDHLHFVEMALQQN